eukprot:CAMPEP_0184309958 /NCGR_PEP_ID=MMETSP1049-20130417/21242_1 /TAXON_ID=77928 /ORGANISM="Proteomonas sulcata, Strain CCMP704" /LENGTH=161 /DNA_ID=CAMNT_0026623271 /DNA_START=146 /DNA_END=632 /DNA_ORIENTATION=+
MPEQQPPQQQTPDTGQQRIPGFNGVAGRHWRPTAQPPPMPTSLRRSSDTWQRQPPPTQGPKDSQLNSPRAASQTRSKQGAEPKHRYTPWHPILAEPQTLTPEPTSPQAPTTQTAHGATQQAATKSNQRSHSSQRPRCRRAEEPRSRGAEGQRGGGAKGLRG